MNVIVLAIKKPMRLDMKLDIGIARRSTTETRHALSFESQRLPVLGSLGDRNLQCFAFWQRDRSYGAVSNVQEVNRQHIAHILTARPDRALRPTSPFRKHARKKLFQFF